MTQISLPDGPKPTTPSLPQPVLNSVQFETPLGAMIVIADQKALYLLEFIERRGLDREVEQLTKKLAIPIIPGATAITKNIAHEIKNYFEGKLQSFETPLQLTGSPFQKSVWQALLKIPPGETRSYLDIAKLINKPTACRAVATAIGSNQHAIIIPCHRVINSNGRLGGYAGGIERKQWLLDHEKGKP